LKEKEKDCWNGKMRKEEGRKQEKEERMIKK
jgi:hypothetical protein